MTDEAGPSPEEQSGDVPQQPSEPVTQEIQHSLVSALVPERVARGAFSTGAVVDMSG
ncbi:MAG: hypothetical protein GXP27_14905, partial [Planctomycetes bacterium]|nr:hypothetical protein [Planctomycetota bacterium]